MYSFQQNEIEIEIFLDIFQNEKPEVSITESTIIVKTKNEMLIKGKLFAKIDKHEISFIQSIQNSTIMIIKLIKKESKIWPVLIISELSGEIDSHSQFILSQFLLTQGEIEKSYELLVKSVEKQNLPAIERLGSIYTHGSEVYNIQPDLQKAFQFWESLAKKNNSLAQFMIGINYHFGEICEKNFLQAEKYYKLAKQNGYPLAALNLGHLYFEGGFGIQKSDEFAVEFWEYSSEFDLNSEAMKNLCVMYLFGRGIKKNIKKAKEYLDKARKIDPEIEIPEDLENLINKEIKEEEENLKKIEKENLKGNLKENQNENQNENFTSFHFSGNHLVSLICLVGIGLVTKYKSKK
ncbi:sel1-repeat-containing protein ybeq [Anaeramoeba ignava]|uniref:Sel1-repeat-containing protein ybeq n=1 Tax=Anaeramoeba ignava TaxID=1746090 RepID=A0A9Q0L926_ANAIG|nr:sel1-repeat-containing protein ybeq [Anaeramoeba ignava]